MLKTFFEVREFFSKYHLTLLHQASMEWLFCKLPIFNDDPKWLFVLMRVKIKFSLVMCIPSHLVFHPDRIKHRGHKQGLETLIDWTHLSDPESN